MGNKRYERQKEEKMDKEERGRVVVNREMRN